MLLALLLLIFILTLFSVRVYVSFDKKRVRMTVKYLWLKVYSLDTSEKKGDKPESEPKPDEEKPEPKPKPDKPEIVISEIPEAPEKPKLESVSEPEPESEEPAEKQDEQEDKEAEKGSSLLDKWNAIKVYLPKVKTALKKLLKLIKIRELEIHLTVGGEDAATAGINFGKINGVFYNALALICCLFSVKIKKTEIKCDYEKKAFDAEGSLLIKARVLSILALAVYILINYLKVKSALDKLDNSKADESNTRKKD